MSSLYRYYFLFFGGIIISTIIFAQDKSNKGKEFWLGYGHNALFANVSPPNSQNHTLYLSAEQAATVTVSVNGTSWSQTVSIPANTVDFSIIIPKSGADDARILSEGLFNKGIHIVSDVPIVVYAHQYNLFSSAATMLMPVETYGYTYYSLNYTQVSNYPDSYSWFYVIASEDNTSILITPSDSTQGGWLPGQTYPVTTAQILEMWAETSTGGMYCPIYKASLCAWLGVKVTALALPACPIIFPPTPNAAISFAALLAASGCPEPIPSVGAGNVGATA